MLVLILFAVVCGLIFGWKGFVLFCTLAIFGSAVFFLVAAILSFAAGSFGWGICFLILCLLSLD